MALSTLEYLNLVSPAFPPRLISPDTGSWFEHIAARLPPCSNFIFECRLAEPEPRADFLVAVIPSDGSLGAWAGKNSLSGAPAFADSNPTWQKITGLLRDWHGGAPDLAPLYDSWLEFDQAQGFPDPSFFFGFDDAVGRNHPKLTESLLTRLYGAALPEGHVRQLRRCFQALPRGAVIFEIGLMFSRPQQEIRLCTRRMTAEQNIPYLESIGWPGPRDELQQYLAELTPHVDAISLDFSIRETTLPEISLECSVHSNKRIPEVLRHLVDLGAARQDKAEAVLEWLGTCSEDSNRERWPQHLLKASAASGAGTRSTFARTFNHFKIMYSPGRPIQAKAYLGVRHFWVQRRPQAATA